MADLLLYYSDKMFYDENKYPLEVRLDEDGYYRWRCVLDDYHDRKTQQFQIKYWAIFSIIGAIAGYLYANVPLSVLREDPSRYHSLLFQRRLLYSFLGYAALFALGMVIMGLCRLIESGPAKYWYKMNDEFIQIKPSGKGSGACPFDEVKRIELYPQVNEIRLITRWDKCPVLVRPEDYELVKDHILAHVPEGVPSTVMRVK